MAGISGATVAEHVGKPVHYVPDFSAVAELVANAAIGRCGCHDGRGRCHDAGSRDRRGAPAGPTAPRRSATRIGRNDRAGGRRRRDGRARGPGRGGVRGSATAGQAGTRSAAPRPARRDRAGQQRSQTARRASWSTSSKPVRGAVRGLKCDAVVLLRRLFVGLGLLLYFTPIMAARNVVITGLGAVTQEEVSPPPPSSRARRCCRSTPTTSPSGWPPSAVSPARGCSGISDPSDHGRRAGARRRQGLSRRPTPVRPRRRGLRDRAAAANLPYLDADNPGPSDPPTRARWR